MVSATPLSTSHRNLRDFACTVYFDCSDIELANFSSGTQRGLRRTKHIVLRLMLLDFLSRWTIHDIETRVPYEHAGLPSAEAEHLALTAHFGKVLHGDIWQSDAG